MPYLLNHKDYFITVDNKARQGLFYQLYGSTGFSRPLQIQPTPSSCFCATLDQANRLHVFSQNSKKQIVHYTFLEGPTENTIILDDSKDTYKFDNLIAHEMNSRLHLFYTATRPNTHSLSLIHQLVSSGPVPVDHLISNFSPLLPLKFMGQDDSIYIFYLALENNIYSINTLHYSQEGPIHTTLVTSEFPINDFDVIVSDGIFHIVYLQDVYGNGQMIYANSYSNSRLPIYASNLVASPSIYSYLNHLWISYMDNNVLYTMLSINQGHSFSSPIVSSLQDNLNQYTYINTKPTSLVANSLYASIQNKVKLATIASIDVEGIHPDLGINTELDLLLDGLNFSSPVTSSLLNSPSLNIQSPQPTIFPEEVIETSAPTPQETQSILSATQAFMNQVQPFNAEPLYPQENSTHQVFSIKEP